MPCTYYETQAEINARNSKSREREEKRTADLNRLTHENDMLREAVLDLLNICREGKLKVDIGSDLEKAININQEAHRKEDLARLKKVFRKNKDALRLGKVMLADPKEPLAPQLGFDPDEF